MDFEWMVVVATKISAYNKVKKYKVNMNRVTHAQCGVDIFVVAFFTLFFRYALSESKKYKLNCVNTMYDETCHMQYFLQVRALREISPHFHHPCLHFFALFCTFVAGARSQRAPHLLLHLHRLLAPALPWPRRLWGSKLQGHQRGDGPKVDNDSLLRYQKPK